MPDIALSKIDVIVVYELLCLYSHSDSNSEITFADARTLSAAWQSEHMKILSPTVSTILPVYNGMSSRQTLFLWCVHEFVVVKTHYSNNQNKRTPQQQIQQMNNMFLLGEQKNRNMFPMVTTHNKICVLSVAMSNIAELCLYYIR